MPVLSPPPAPTHQLGGARFTTLACPATGSTDTSVWLVEIEAGTPAIIEAIGLAAAVDYVESIGVDAIHAHECMLVGTVREALARKNSVTVFGPENSAGIVSFAMTGVHPHDIGTILDESGVAIRAGHHCAQPLMEHLGVPATARASFGMYSNEDDVAALIEGLARVERIFG